MENNPVLPANIRGINSQQASFQFEGHFNNQPITWQCTLLTLEQHYRNLLAKGEVSADEQVELKKFIHINNNEKDRPVIHIGLDVKLIDEPTIRKTIIMVHNYKNLHNGFHAYGDSYIYPGK